MMHAKGIRDWGTAVLLTLVVGCGVVMGSAQKVGSIVFHVPEIESPQESVYSDRLIGVLCRGLPDQPNAYYELITWGYRDRELSPGAYLKARDYLEFELIDWLEVPEGIKKSALTSAVADPTIPRFFASTIPLDAGAMAARAPHFKESKLETGEPTADHGIKGRVFGSGNFLTAAKNGEFLFYGTNADIYLPGLKVPQVGEEGDPWKGLTRFAEDLNEAGIKLMVTFAPQAATLYPDLIDGMPYSPEKEGWANERIRNRLPGLEARGMTAVDLTETLFEKRWFDFEGVTYPAYLRNDSHWASMGCQIAAGELAEQVLEILPEFGERAIPKGEFSVRGEQVEFQGHLDNDPMVKALGFDAETAGSPTVRFTVEGQTEQAKTALDPVTLESEIYLIGDSYTNIHGKDRAGLHAHLVREIGAPVHLIYRSGNAYNEARRALVETLNSQDHRPKVVILVIAERYGLREMVELPGAEF